MGIYGGATTETDGWIPVPGGHTWAPGLSWETGGYVCLVAPQSHVHYRRVIAGWEADGGLYSSPMPLPLLHPASTDHYSA